MNKEEEAIRERGKAIFDAFLEALEIDIYKVVEETNKKKKVILKDKNL
jgi:hypothetical protein